MRVSVNHRLGTQEARRRIDGIVDRLIARDWPGSVTVRNPERQWEGERLAFSFELVRAFFAVTVAGHVEVGEDTSAIDVAIPSLVESFIGGDRIRAVLERELSAALE